jgi:hypothetical protein
MFFSGKSVNKTSKVSLEYLKIWTPKNINNRHGDTVSPNFLTKFGHWQKYCLGINYIKWTENGTRIWHFKFQEQARRKSRICAVGIRNPVTQFTLRFSVLDGNYLNSYVSIYNSRVELVRRIILYEKFHYGTSGAKESFAIFPFSVYFKPNA